MIKKEDLLTIRDRFDTLTSKMHQVIIGQDRLIERLFVALIADGHLLLEGVPGLAKTKTLSTLTRLVSAKMNRIQFTPDLLPADLIGTEVFRPATGEFVIRHGPLFTNLLLADEVNRAPAKVQSALLQAMQERQVTIGEKTFLLPRPFMVLATQNPIEQEGTYQLPEAQLDRFLFKVVVSYPSVEDEARILAQARAGHGDESQVGAVIKTVEIEQIRSLARFITVDPKIDRYIVSLVTASRSPDSVGLKGLIAWGASPRASLALESCSRALALLRGQSFVTPDEVKDLALDVLRHRIIPSFEAEAQSITTDMLIRKILDHVAIP